MATFSRREVTTRRVEFLVPAVPPYGASWVEVMKAIHAATAELVALGLLAEHAEPAGDQIWIRPGDEDVAVVFEVDPAEPRSPYA